MLKADYLKIEQAKAVFSNSRSLIAGMVGVSLITVYLFWETASTTGMLVWLAASLAIIVGRLATFRAFHGKTIIAENAQYWLNFSVLWSFFTGLHWGMVPIFFLETEQIMQSLFLGIVYTGHMSGAISTNSAYSRGFIGVAVPATLCFAGRFFYAETDFFTTLGIVAIFYFFVCLALSRNSAKLFREARELNYENMQLMEELVAQKNAAEYATRSKDRFLAAASHDLRQPLHSSGLLLSALEAHVSSPEGKELLNDIKASGEALNHSFNSLLDVSRLDAGVVEPSPRHFDLLTYMSPLVRDATALASEKHLVLKTSSNKCVVLADPVLLERILNNLISNAVTYTDDGSVSVDWRQLDNGRVRVLVEDTGIGIEASQMIEVFSEYFQVNNPARDRAKGFGLGLAIVKRLCEISSIDLYISSTLGKGTSIALYLEAGNSEHIIRPANEDVISSDLSGHTILVVDDDPAVRKSMIHVLNGWGCHVLDAESEIQAIKVVADCDRDIDLMIADYRLGEGKTGVEAIEGVGDELNRTIPAVVITGDTSPSRLKQLTKSGYPVLHKPVTPAGLRAVIQRMLMT